MPGSRLVLAACMAACTVVPQASAQEDPRLTAIEAQIRALQTELAKVRRDLASSRAETRAAARPARAAAVAATPAAASPALMQASSGNISEKIDPEAPAAVAGGTESSGRVAFPKGRPTFTSDDKRFSAAIGLQLHYDLGGYFNGTKQTAQPPRLNSFGQNLRRGRIPIVFKYDDFQVNITPDFGGSPDGSPTIYEANINYAPKGTPLTATLGYFKPWLTLGDSQGSNDFFFLERPGIVEASRNIAAGDARSAAGVRWAENRYFLAAYLTGAPYGSQQAGLAQPQQTGGTLRLAGRPVAGGDTDLHLGVSASQAFHIQRTSAGQTLTIQDRPELRIDSNRLVGTGALNASGAYSYGPEIALRWKKLLLQGEYIRMGVERANSPSSPLPSLAFDGGYVEASWVIAGEARAYDPDEGAFGRPKVKQPFSVKDGRYGALELVGRYSTIDLNDKVTRGIAQSVTGGVYGGRQTVYAVGLNWYPNDFLRFMLDYDIVNVDRLNAAGTTQIGRRFQAVALRAQASF